MTKVYPSHFLFVNNINRSKYIFGKQQDDIDYCFPSYFPRIYLLLLIILTNFTLKLIFLFRYIIFLAILQTTKSQEQ